MKCSRTRENVKDRCAYQAQFLGKREPLKKSHGPIVTDADLESACETIYLERTLSDAQSARASDNSSYRAGDSSAQLMWHRLVVMWPGSHKIVDRGPDCTSEP